MTRIHKWPGVKSVKGVETDDVEIESIDVELETRIVKRMKSSPNKKFMFEDANVEPITTYDENGNREKWKNWDLNSVRSYCAVRKILWRLEKEGKIANQPEIEDEESEGKNAHYWYWIGNV